MTTKRIPRLFLFSLLLAAALFLFWKGQKLYALRGEQKDHPKGGEHAGHDEGKRSHEGEGDDDHGDDDHGKEKAPRHDDHGEEDVVRLDPEEIEEFGIVVGTAQPGDLATYIRLTGEVALNQDRLSHLVPRVGGVVREVRKRLGDPVRAGEVLALLESRELADAKAAYLAALARMELARSNFLREKRLWKKQISSEQEYLEAKQSLAEMEIDKNAARQKLLALGLSRREIEALPDEPEEKFTEYKITAPFAGTVIGKHITLGEVLDATSTPFTIADLSTVWIDLRVYPKDLHKVREGLEVLIHDPGRVQQQGTISFLSPLIDEETRTTLARVVLPNKEGHWRPGHFISALVASDPVPVALLIPKSAIETVDGKTTVFVETKEGFEPRPVKIGRTNETHVEILDGLKPGDRYVVSRAFSLKAELGKSAFGEGHAH